MKKFFNIIISNLIIGKKTGSDKEVKKQPA